MTVMFNTKQGVYGPGGNGGGIFQTTIQGLGATARAGAAENPFVGIPASCWNDSGFKNCSNLKNKQVNDELYWNWNNDRKTFPEAPGSATWKKNFNERWNQLLHYECVPKYCGSNTKQIAVSSSTTTEMKNLPWSSYSSATKNIQYTLNDILPTIGKPKVSTDGKLGGKTCQAIYDVIKSGKASGFVIPAVCAGKYSTKSTSSSDKAGLALGQPRLLILKGCTAFT